MSLNVKVNPQIHNRFDIWKENVKTGVKEQVGYAENIVLDAMWSRLCSGSSYFDYIHYGTGTGSLSPTRTSLFSYLGSGSAVTVETVRAIPTSHWRRSITLGLTTANGNTLTEVGIANSSSSSYLVTHAQIRDMNGNPTGIVKTDVDIITIYATVYITLVNDHPSIKLIHTDSNSLLSYLLGGSFPSAVFRAGMSDKSLDWPAELGSYTIGSSATGSWSADTANKRKTSTMRFGTTVANGHIKELLFSNIARLVLPATGIYSGLELSDVPIGVGDGVSDKFDLPSAYIDQESIVAKVNGVSSATTKTDTNVIYMLPSITGGNHAGSGSGVAFSSDNTIMAVASDGDPAITMYKDIDSVWTKMPNVTGGYPNWRGYGVAFSPVSAIMALTHYDSPYITMYKDIDGVWTKMPGVTGGNPTGGGSRVAFSPDGTIMAVTHSGSPYITMYKDIDGVWTKMPDVTGGLPTDGRGVAFSPDSTIMALTSSGSPYITMYKDIDGVWTKMPNVTGGYPTGQSRGVAFSPDSTIMALTSSGSPYITMYKDIDGVWTKMPNVTGGYPTGQSRAVAFSSDSAIMAIVHNDSPAITLYKDIAGVWTKMPNPAGGVPLGDGYGLTVSPDGTIMAMTHSLGTPRVTMYAIAPIMTQITFSTPPAEGAVITADYTVNGIHKTSQRVIDVSGEIQFGGPE